MVATRRNDRELVHATGEPVRNRDRWTVAATHPDGSLTVSHAPDTATVDPPSRLRPQHVRLGYAATEHGNQGDTVDVGIDARHRRHHPPRPLRRRHPRPRRQPALRRHRHRVTSTRPANVLEASLTRDRADVPAISQRRALAVQQPSVSPVVEPKDVILGWVAPYQAWLEDRRDQLLERFRRRDDERAVAMADLHELQPLSTPARAPWQPHADRIAPIQHQLQAELRPALWRANSEEMHAGFGHHRGTRRRAHEVTFDRVDETQAHIAEIRADGAGIKDVLDGRVEVIFRSVEDVLDARASARISAMCAWALPSTREVTRVLVASCRGDGRIGRASLFGCSTWRDATRPGVGAEWRRSSAASTRTGSPPFSTNSRPSVRPPCGERTAKRMAPPIRPSPRHEATSTRSDLARR